MSLVTPTTIVFHPKLLTTFSTGFPDSLQDKCPE